MLSVACSSKSTSPSHQSLLCHLRPVSHCKLRLTPTSSPHLHPRQSSCFSSVTKSNSLSFSSSASGFASPLAVEKELRSSFVTEAVRHVTGSLMRGEGLQFAIVVARFNEVVTKLLLEGAIETFKKYSVREEDIQVIWVPASFEIGVVAQNLGKSGNFDSGVMMLSQIRYVLQEGMKMGLPLLVARL